MPIFKTRKEDLPIVRGREIRIVNYWREFFSSFSKKTNDGEMRLGTIRVAQAYTCNNYHCEGI